MGLWMHDVLRDMGREIVRQQSLKEPGERSRLWYKEEVLQVLRDCTGTKSIEGISLELPASNNEHVNINGFANMRNLRLLHLNYLQRLSGNYITTSRNLKWLCWHGFPLAYIPAALYMENLVAIDLPYSKLKQIWKGPKRLDKLRFLNLSHSYHLIKTPDFSGLKSLEMLLLNDCTSLVKVHNSIGCLDKLLVLNMANCINLRKVPSSLFMLKYLEKLDFSGCSKLWELAECKVRFTMFGQWLTKRQEYIPISMASVQGLSCLQKLNLADCNLEYVPSEIGRLITLKSLDLSGNKFCSLPSSFSHLSHLKDLDLNSCLQLNSLAHLPTNLANLYVDNCISLETVSFGTGVASGMRSIIGNNMLYMAFWNCPKVDSESVNNSLKRYFPESVSYDIWYPGGKLPHDMQFECIGSERLSFVVPPLVDKKIIGFTAGAVLSDVSSPPRIEIVNETKRNISPNNSMSYLWWWGWPESKIDEDCVWITYVKGHIWNSTLEGGDKVDIFVETGRAHGVKGLGFSLIYDDADVYLESNIEEAN